jgi:branched-chain amino acid transport system permease protein
MIIIAPSQGGQFVDMSLLILPGLAAALCGLFRSLPLTAIGGVLIGAIGGMTVQWDLLAPYSDSVPFFVVLIILLVTQRRETWDAAR